MDISSYQKLALRTESKVEKIVLNKNELNHLLMSFVTITEILDGVKKKAFYNNPKKYDEKYKEYAEKLHYFSGCSDRHHEICDDVELQVNTRVFHGCLGILTEAGELAEHLLNMINKQELDDAGIVEEIIDMNWYMAIMFDALGKSWEQGWINNINKLKIRFPDGYSDIDAEHRDTAAERIELEK